MNNQQIASFVNQIIEIRNTLKAAANTDNEGARGLYLRSAREGLEALEKDVTASPENLLKHLCSLTVAERETILRASDMFFQQVAFDDSMTDAQRVDWVAAVIIKTETKLRNSVPELWPFDDGSGKVKSIGIAR